MSETTEKARDKKEYRFTCPKCGKELWAKPSLMMTEFGRNSGHGNCPKCKTFFHLEITPDIYGDEMKAEIWDTYLQRTIKMSDLNRSEYYVIVEAAGVYPISLQFEAWKDGWHFYRYFHNVLILRRSLSSDKET